MIQVQIADSKKRERTLSISGYVKPSGSKVARVTNDESEVYFVQIRKNGTTTCRHASDNEPCKGHKFTGHCYHVKAVKTATLPTFEEVTATPVEQPAGIEVNALLLKNRQLYRSGKWNENGKLTPVSKVMPNEYDILAPTKKVSHAYGCCGHIVKLEDAGELCGPCRCK